MEGETIQWIDQPIPVFFSPTTTVIFLVGTVVTSFSSFLICGAAGVLDLHGPDPGRLLVAAFGIPFVLIGFGMLSTPLWMYRFSKRTIYAITDYRAIVVQGTFSGLNVTSYYRIGSRNTVFSGGIFFPIEV
jgi:hypothetical protein